MGRIASQEVCSLLHLVHSKYLHILLTTLTLTKIDYRRLDCVVMVIGNKFPTKRICRILKINKMLSCNLFVGRSLWDGRSTYETAASCVHATSARVVVRVSATKRCVKCAC